MGDSGSYLRGTSVEEPTGMDRHSEGHHSDSDRSRGSGLAHSARKSGSHGSRDSVHLGGGTGRGQPERATHRSYTAELPQWYRTSVVLVSAIGITIVLIIQMLYGG
jgi:hypothetical protein